MPVRKWWEHGEFESVAKDKELGNQYKSKKGVFLNYIFSMQFKVFLLAPFLKGIFMPLIPSI